MSLTCSSGTVFEEIPLQDVKGMEKKESKGLNIKDQLMYLWAHGELVAKIHNKNERRALYQIDTFYVELITRSFQLRPGVKAWELAGLHYGYSTRMLDPYLRKIQLPEDIISLLQIQK
jgi:hypothetical protein